MHRLIGTVIERTLYAVGIKRIRTQLLTLNILLVGFGLLAIVSIYMGQANDASVINEAGRQRMLSQRMAKKAVMVAQGIERPAVVEQTMETFERTLRRLQQGERAAGFSAVGGAPIRQQLVQVGRLWTQYRHVLEGYVHKPDNMGLARIHDLSPKVLGAMDGAVKLMEQRANQYAYLRAVWAVAMIVLLLLFTNNIRIYTPHTLMNPMEALRAYLGPS